MISVELVDVEKRVGSLGDSNRRKAADIFAIEEDIPERSQKNCA